VLIDGGDDARITGTTEQGNAAGLIVGDVGQPDFQYHEGTSLPP
jgi:hypothetical protein